MPKQVALSLETLSLIDGGVHQLAFQDAIAKCVQDCRDRPFEEKSRSFTLQLVFTPRTSAAPGATMVDLDDVEMQLVWSQAKLPPQKSGRMRMDYSLRDNSLTFEPDNPDGRPRLDFEPEPSDRDAE